MSSSSIVTWLVPQPESGARPTSFPSPFDEVAPHPLAQRCAQLLQDDLRTGHIAPGLPTSVLSGPEGGKMFGVLAVGAADGRVGFLRAISGQVQGAWNIEGYAPPVFDAALRSRVEVPAEVQVKSLTARVEAARLEPSLLAARQNLAELEALHAKLRAARKEHHASRKMERHLARAAALDPGATEALSRQSRSDDLERRRAEGRFREERAAVIKALHPFERRLAALERLRRLVSREAMRLIWGSYQLTNFAQESTSLRALFPGGDPPSGAADCAAPKLLAAARAAMLQPLALAEFWWGAPPPGGARTQGMYFPACKEKCGPVVPFLLGGLKVAPRESWRPLPVKEEQQHELHIVHQEARFLVLQKPPGVLSVPGRDEAVTDSLVSRVLRRFPQATGPLAVHRLDLDTSGLMVVALDLEVYRLLQAQFLSRAVHKRYVAILEGAPRGEEGVIELPLRVDLEQRPRQLVDFQHGRPALTRWRVLSRQGGRTRVAFFPLTGRTHQLRVHASHRLGLGAPIVGDRLYGQPDARLMLHAEALRFRHPLTGAELLVQATAPF